MRLPLPDQTVAGKQSRLAVKRDGAGVASIQRGDRLRLASLGHGHDDRIHEPELEAWVAAVQLPRAFEVPHHTPVDHERAFGHIIEERLLDGPTKMAEREVVDFRKNRPGKKPGATVTLEESPQRGMVSVIGVEERQDGARIGNDHRRRPIPFSNSSARALRVPVPLRPAPMLRGARCTS